MIQRYLLGLLVLVAAVLGGAWIFEQIQDGGARTGVRLEVLFRSSRGLREGAAVRYRGITVGDVARLRIEAGGENIVAELLLREDVTETLGTSARFWIVSPRFAGVTRGASGLETLIKDSYVAYVSPANPGLPLAPGTRIPGLEEPPPDSDLELGNPEPGDILLEVVFAESHGLQPGNPVRFRGLPTGDVRHVALSADGRAVIVKARVQRRYRHTVTDRCQFWVARPRLEGSVMSGLSLRDAEALLAPYLTYACDAAQPGQPAVDGARFLGLGRAPEPQEQRPSLDASEAPPAGSGESVPVADRVVRVLYECVERDTFDPDDQVSVSGTGIAFRDAHQRIAVLTTRSVVDGAWFVADKFGKQPDIDKEAIRVQMPDGSVHGAGRVWVHAGELDLALLLLQDVDPARAPAGKGPIVFEPLTEVVGGEWEMLVAPAAGKPMQRQRIEVGADGALLLPAPAADHKGALLLRQGQVRALIGQRGGHDPQQVPVPLGELPPELRPGDG